MLPPILIVEDEPVIAETLSFTLRNEGYAVQHVSTAQEAFAALAVRLPALVILDVGLPDLSGFEVCRRIRAQHNALPVMFLTARSEEIDRVLGFEIGADDYVLKPFSPREVLHAVVRTAITLGLQRFKQTLCRPRLHAQDAVQS